MDTNLLVYAHRRDSEFHGAAVGVVTELAESGRPWAIPWPCVHEFLGVVTHERLFRPPSTRSEALVQVEVWRKSPTLLFLGESEDHWSRLSGLVTAGAVTGPRVHDARIAAICASHGVTELWSADRDFSRFPSLRVRNPLVRR